MGSKKHKKQKSEHRISEYEDGSGGQEKPLKLVLNLRTGIGSSQDSLVDEGSSPASEDRRHRHKKKKKKKSSEKEKERSRYAEHHHQVVKESYKRQREEEDSAEENEVEMVQAEEVPSAVESDRVTEPEPEPEPEPQSEDAESSSPSRKFREPRTCTVRESDGYVLKHMLNYLLKNLQNKDVHGFFAFPVTDAIAPGYSSIIPHPMDFSTMAAKIEAGEYQTVMEFKKDFALMCNNAMTYNRQETIFYKEAKRLLQIGVRALSKEKLLHLKKAHSYMTSISLQELGFDESGHMLQMDSRSAFPREDGRIKLEEQAKQGEEARKIDPASQEEIEAAEILIQAQEAAQEAKNTLVARKPKTDLGFLRMDENGTTSMTVLNPWSGEEVNSKQRVISLGDYMGKLKTGTGSLFKYKEDKRNRVDTETYLCYGPFSSHAPSYDSSFASCTKEESDLLLSTYGGDIGVQYAKSVQKFVENAGSSAIDMVDKLLDTLTNGQHSKARVVQEQQKRREEEQIQKALQDEMITKAQQAADEADAEAAKDKVQQNLNETAALLSELSQTQNERLSQNLPPHLTAIPSPSKKEATLADQVSDSLVQMAKQVNPNDVVSTTAVRGALGITTYPAGAASRQPGAANNNPSSSSSYSSQPSSSSASASRQKGNNDAAAPSDSEDSDSDSESSDDGEDRDDSDDDDDSDDNDTGAGGAPPSSSGAEGGGMRGPESMEDEDNSDEDSNAGFGEL